MGPCGPGRIRETGRQPEADSEPSGRRRRTALALSDAAHVARRPAAVARPGGVGPGRRAPRPAGSLARARLPLCGLTLAVQADSDSTQARPRAG